MQKAFFRHAIVNPQSPRHMLNCYQPHTTMVNQLSGRRGPSRISGFSYLDYMQLLHSHYWLQLQESGLKCNTKGRVSAATLLFLWISAFPSWCRRVKILAVIPSNLTKSDLNAWLSRFLGWWNPSPPQKHILAAFPVAQPAFLTYFHKDLWELEFKARCRITLHFQIQWNAHIWGNFGMNRDTVEETSDTLLDWRRCLHTEGEEGELGCVDQECFRSLEVTNPLSSLMSLNDWGLRQTFKSSPPWRRDRWVKKPAQVTRVSMNWRTDVLLFAPTHLLWNMTNRKGWSALIPCHICHKAVSPHF